MITIIDFIVGFYSFWLTIQNHLWNGLCVNDIANIKARLFF